MSSPHHPETFLLRLPNNLQFWAAAIFLPFALTWGATALIYGLSPAYLDHVEPAVTVITQQWMHGRPLYHDPAASPYQYSVLYGPSCFLSLRLWLSLISDPILASKVSGAGWSFLSLVFLLCACVRRSGWLPAIAGIGIVTGAFFQFREPEQFLATLWDRPDPILIACSAAGLVALTVRNRRLGAALLGLALGVAVNGKIHGFLYLMPAGAVWLHRNGFRASVAPLVLGGIVAIIPFLLPGISPGAYLSWLRLAARHPFKIDLLAENLCALVILFVPLAFLPRTLAWTRPWRQLGEDNVLLLTLAIAGLLVCVPASKEGSGPAHLLPFAPYGGYLFAAALARTPGHLRPGWRLGLVFPWLLSALFVAVSHVHLVVSSWRDGATAGAEDDLRSLLKRYNPQDIQMGCGGDDQYLLTFYAPWIYQAGAPRVADPASCMDMKESGLSLAPLETSLRDRKFNFWLIPRGDQPFSMNSLYDPNPPLFEPSAARTFLLEYSLVESTRYYDIYRANGPSR